MSIFAARIIPVVVIGNAEHAKGLGEALVAGGIPVAEVTFRTAAAPEAIRRLASVAGLAVGAGTVLNADQVDEAVEAGARFIVSPGLSRSVVERAQARQVPVYPGAVTASEIMAALEMGLTTLKFFPAETSGGVAALAALHAPFGQVRFIPTGGVSPANLASYLALPNVAAVGGSWMVKQSLLDSGSFEDVRELAAQAARAAGGGAGSREA
jgi:2-dehydro-3-deoxyphosphogluconate aldolase/(4S)-4-hydroxy-2-oxoglutarate aldolase